MVSAGVKRSRRRMRCSANARRALHSGDETVFGLSGAPSGILRVGRRQRAGSVGSREAAKTSNPARAKHDKRTRRDRARSVTVETQWGGRRARAHGEAVRGLEPSLSLDAQLAASLCGPGPLHDLLPFLPGARSAPEHEHDVAEVVPDPTRVHVGRRVGEVDHRVMGLPGERWPQIAHHGLARGQLLAQRHRKRGERAARGHAPLERRGARLGLAGERHPHAPADRQHRRRHACGRAHPLARSRQPASQRPQREEPRRLGHDAGREHVAHERHAHACGHRVEPEARQHHERRGSQRSRARRPRQGRIGSGDGRVRDRGAGRGNRRGRRHPSRPGQEPRDQGAQPEAARAREQRQHQLGQVPPGLGGDEPRGFEPVRHLRHLGPMEELEPVAPLDLVPHLESGQVPRRGTERAPLVEPPRAERQHVAQEDERPHAHAKARRRDPRRAERAERREPQHVGPE